METIETEIRSLWPRRGDSTYLRDLLHTRLHELRVLRRIARSCTDG